MNVVSLCFLLLSVALSNCHNAGGRTALQRMLGKNRELIPHTGKLNLKQLLSGNFRKKDDISPTKDAVKESSGDVLDRALHKVMDNMDDQSKAFIEKVGEKVIEEQRKVYLNSNGRKLLDDAAEKIGDKIVDQHEDLSDGHDLNPILDLIQSDSSDISDKREYSRKKREVDSLLNQFGGGENEARNVNLQKMVNDNQLKHHIIKSKHEMKRDTREESENSEITMDDLVNVLQMTRNLVPDELEAAARGALAMGKHLGFRVGASVEPLASAGYKEVATNYIPRARKAASGFANTSPRKAFKMLSDMVSQQTIDNIATTGDMAMDGANTMAKWGARVGNNFASTSAGLLSKAGGQMAVGGANLLLSTLSRLQSEATEVEAQLEKVATDFTREASTEYVPKLVPVLQDLVVDLQDTLELAGQFFVTDIQPFLQRSAEPAYHAVVEQVEPTFETVAEYVKPAYQRLRPVVEYVKPAYQRLRPVVKEAGKEATMALLDAGLEARRVYDQSVKPTLGEISHQARPALKNLASNVADSAMRVGKTLQDDIAPPMAKGLKQTLHTVFTKMPSLVQQLSHEAHDAAKVFSKGYDKAFNDINQREALEMPPKASNKRKKEDNYRNVNKYNREEVDYSTEVDASSADLKEVLDNFDKKHITRPGHLAPTENQTNRDL